MKPRRGLLTARVLDLGLWGETPLFLLDVGCSGGIEGRWRPFGDHLRAIGFDPLVAEINRLEAANPHSGTRYEATFVGCRGYDELFPPELRDDRIASKNNQPFPRSSAAAAMQQMQTSYVQQVFNAGAPVVVADRSIALDDYIPADEHAHVDFIKIDTDGHDIEVLLGASGIIAAGGVLGLTIEAQFHGPVHPYANTFSNIDRLLRQHGFTLFDLDCHRYSRAELPAPFEAEITAQTTSGQMMWGEALYFRDLGDPTYEQMWAYALTAERVMKLACLFEQFGLPDCAAELLLNRGGFLEADIREGLLDLLTGGEAGSYRAHVAAFEQDFTRFYPSRMAREADSPALTKSPRRGMDELHERVATLTEKNEQLRRKLKARGERLDWMTSRVAELKSKRTPPKKASR